jgi:AraC-like DNA-binding protein
MVVKGKKPSEIYLDLGFETLQYFSFTFKKLSRMIPYKLIVKQEKAISP